MEAWLRHAELSIVGADPTPSGTQGSKLLTLSVPANEGRLVFRAKWRSYESGGIFSEPRKELAAYAVQRLFLEPHGYVVPPTSGRCFDLEEYRYSVEAAADPSFEGVTCVYGILSYWLENVQDIRDAVDKGLLETEGSLLDEGLFERSAAYRRSVADLNVFTYLIDHGDAHDEQFMITKARISPRVYSVDHSMSFSFIKNPMLLFRQDWSRIQVPALASEAIARLSVVDRQDLGALAVIEQYALENGLLVPVEPTGPIGSSDTGLRWVGLTLKIGLTRSEIDGVRQRIENLLARVRSGSIRTF